MPIGEDTIIEKGLKGLETSGSLLRNAIIDTIDGDTDVAAKYSDIMTGKDYKPANEFIKDIGSITGLYDYETKGDNWLESLGKGALEFTVDVLTDPVTYISMGLGGVAAKGAKAAGAAAKTATTAGLLTDLASTGVIAGALTPAEDGFERFTNSLSGAALGLGLGSIVKGAAVVGKKGGDLLADAVNMELRPELKNLLAGTKFENMGPSEADALMKASKGKTGQFVMDLKELTGEMIETHGIDEISSATNILKRYEKKYNSLREAVFKNLDFKTGDQARLNRINTVLNNKSIETMKASGEYTPAVKALIDRNEFIVKEYNSTWKDQMDMVGINVHTPQLLDPDQLLSLKKTGVFKQGFVKRKNIKGLEDVDPIEALRLEPEMAAKALLTSEEKAAHNMMAVMRTSPIVKYKNVEKALDTWDGLTTRMKQSMLTLSHTWFKNNFIENVARSYMQDGVMSAFDVAKNMGKVSLNKATFGKVLKDDPIVKDTMALLKKGSDTDFVKWSDESGLTKIARDEGAMTGGMFEHDLKSEAGVKTALLKKGKNYVIEQLGKEADQPAVVKIIDKVLEKSGDTVGAAGRQIENTARLMSFKHTIDRYATDEMKAAIKKFKYDGAAEMYPELKQIYKSAKEITDKHFFDYGDLTLFEEKFMKRLMPFYSFFSKNIPYWTEQLATNKAKVHNLAKAGKHLVQYDPELTDWEKAGLSEYTRNQIYGYDRDEGITKMLPNLSVWDFIGTMTDPVSNLRGKLHPSISSSINLLTGTSGLGGNLYPSDTYAQSRPAGYNEKVFALPAQMAGSNSTYKDPHTGKLMVTDNFIPIAGQALNGVLPVPALSVMANILGKGYDAGDGKSKEAMMRELLNAVSGVKEVKDTEVTRGKRWKREVIRDRRERKKEANKNKIDYLRNIKRDPASISEQENDESNDPMDSFRTQAAKLRAKLNNTGNRQDSVGRKLINALVTPAEAMPSSFLDGPRSAVGISDIGVKNIIGEEGFRPNPYRNKIKTESGKYVLDVPTIGYGTTVYPNGKKVSMNDKSIDEQTAINFLKIHADKDDKIIRKFMDKVRFNPSQNEMDVLLGLSYNSGAGKIIKGSIGNAIKSGDRQAIARAIAGGVNTVKGKSVAALRDRRSREAQQFLYGIR